MTDEGAESAATEVPSQESHSRRTTTQLRDLAIASADEYHRLIEPLIYAMVETDRLEGRQLLFDRANRPLQDLFDRLRKAAEAPLDGQLGTDPTH